MTLDILYGVAVIGTEATVEPPPFIGILAVIFLQVLVQLGSLREYFLAPLAPEYVDNILHCLFSLRLLFRLDIPWLFLFVMTLNVRSQRESTALLQITFITFVPHEPRRRVEHFYMV